MCPPNDNTSNKHVPWPISALAIVLTLALAPVLGILAYPVLHPPRRAYTSLCANNMKEMAVAVSIYSDDWAGFLPSSAIVRGSGKWNRADFLKFATKPGNDKPTKSRATYREVIYDYIRAKSTSRCPQDPLKDDSRLGGTNASYHWKLAIDKAWYGEGCSKPYRKIDDYPYAADTILLYERQGFHDEQKPLGNGVGINIAYLDTHVRHVHLKNAAGYDGEPMYFNYDYKADKGLPSETTPAKWTDPSRYGDRL